MYKPKGYIGGNPYMAKHKKGVIYMNTELGKELYKYLKQFMLEENWYSNENIPRQARALFVSICIVEEIEADTAAADNMLLELYTSSKLDDLMEYEDFENFMYEYMI